MHECHVHCDDQWLQRKLSICNAQARPLSACMPACSACNRQPAETTHVPTQHVPDARCDVSARWSPLGSGPLSRFAVRLRPSRQCRVATHSDSRPAAPTPHGSLPRGKAWTPRRGSPRARGRPPPAAPTTPAHAPLLAVSQYRSAARRRPSLCTVSRPCCLLVVPESRPDAGSFLA